MRDIVVFCGSSHTKLGDLIALRLGIQLGSVKLGKFSNNETSVQVFESVRDMDVYLIQSGCGHVNNHLMELLIMVNACKMAAARSVTCVLPLFPYARQSDVPYKRQSARRPLQASSAETKKQEQEQPSSQLFHTGVNESSSVGNNGPLFSTGQLQKSSSFTRPAPANPCENNHHLRIPSNSNNGSAFAKAGYRNWVARSGTLVANMIQAAGANHIITMDLHDPQFQGYFDVPVDNLYGSPLMIKYVQEKIVDYKKAVIVSPDAGGAKRASNIAHKLGISFALIHKERKANGFTSPMNISKSSSPTASMSREQRMHPLASSLNTADAATMSAQNNLGDDFHSSNTVGLQAATISQSMDIADMNSNMLLVGDVRDKTCILIDDIADTSRTITKAAQILHDHGAKKIYALVTHGILSGDAAQLIKQSKIDYLVVSNSVPQEKNIAILGDKLRVFDVAGIIAEAIRRVHHGESVSYLYEPVAI